MTVTAAPPPDPGTVTLVDGQLRVDALAVTDPDVLAAARRHAAARPGDPLAGWLVQHLALGVRAAALASGSVDDAAAALRLEELARRARASADAAVQRVERAVADAADPDRGTVAVTVRGALDRLTADVRQLVAAEDAPVRNAIEAALARSTSASVEEISRGLRAQTEAMRSALALGDPASPLGFLLAEVRRAGEEQLRQLGELRAVVESTRAREAVVARTPLAGVGYEAAVVDAVTEVGHRLGDVVEATGTVTGVTGGKVGDAVLTVGERTARGLSVRVAVEAKAAAMSSAKWRRELDDAAENRGALAALGVVRGPELVPGGAASVFVLDPRHLVVAWREGDPVDLLSAAYQLCRASAVVSAAQAAGADRYDVAALESALHEAQEALTGFDLILRAESTSRRGLDDLRKATVQLRQTLERLLARGLRGDERRGA